MIGSTSIEIRRRLPAPPSEVFRWWTEPAFVSRWMTPIGDVEASIEPRVGGALRIVMSGGGMVIEHIGKFVEFDRPRRLAFTWSSRYTGPRPSLVTVEFEPAGEDSTEIRLVHTELPEEAAASHSEGWEVMLARLQGLLTPEGEDAD